MKSGRFLGWIRRRGERCEVYYDPVTPRWVMDTNPGGAPIRVWHPRYTGEPYHWEVSVASLEARYQDKLQRPCPRRKVNA